MTISDPIGDMLNRIRTALVAGHTSTTVPNSKVKVSIARILQDEGYIDGFDIVKKGSVHSSIELSIRYVGQRLERRPVIRGIKRVSKPGQRVYTGRSRIPRVLSGIGIAIMSTPKGVMTGRRARRLGVGGEVLCHIW
jgi:small subunit ribosomal protein S8